MEKKKLTKKQILMRVLIAVLAIILALAIAAALVVNYILGKIGSAYDTDPWETVPPGEEWFETDPDDYVPDYGDYTDPDDDIDPDEPTDPSDPTDPVNPHPGGTEGSPDVLTTLGMITAENAAGGYVCYQWQAPANGTMVIGFTGDWSCTVKQGDKALLNQTGSGKQVQFAVTKGKTYVVQVAPMAKNEQTNKMEIVAGKLDMMWIFADSDDKNAGNTGSGGSSSGSGSSSSGSGSSGGSSSGGTTVKKDPTDWSQYKVEQLQDKNIINILLVGSDARPGQGRTRADAILLLSINKKTGNITLFSFMRDLYVQIPGYSDNRINAAYYYGGPKLLNKTLQKNFGITVHGNVCVGFSQFKQIVDILGGVEIELTKAEATYLNQKGAGPLSAGKQKLRGSQALNYCRIRKLAGESDLERTQRQRNLLSAVAEMVRGSSIVELWKIIEEVLPHVYTDMDKSEMLQYATEGLKALAGGGKVNYSGKEYRFRYFQFKTIRKMSVIVPDLTRCNQQLKRVIYTY